MEFDTAVFYWIKEHLQSRALDIWIKIFTDKYMVYHRNSVLPGLPVSDPFLRLPAPGS